MPNFPVSRKARFVLPALSIIAFWGSTQRALLSRQTKMELSRSFYNNDASQYSISTRTRLTRIFRCGCIARSGTQASECSLINGGMVTGHAIGYACTLVFMPPSVTQSNSAICRERDVAKYQTPNIFCVKLTQSVLGVGHFAVHECMTRFLICSGPNCALLQRKTKRDTRAFSFSVVLTSLSCPTPLSNSRSRDVTSLRNGKHRFALTVQNRYCP